MFELNQNTPPNNTPTQSAFSAQLTVRRHTQFMKTLRPQAIMSKRACELIANTSHVLSEGDNGFPKVFGILTFFFIHETNDDGAACRNCDLDTSLRRFGENQCEGHVI